MYQRWQRDVEEALFVSQRDVEAVATELVEAGDKEGAADVLSEFSAVATSNTHSRWTDLFENLIARYHDGYSMASQTATTVDMRRLW